MPLEVVFWLEEVIELDGAGLSVELEEEGDGGEDLAIQKIRRMW